MTTKNKIIEKLEIEYANSDTRLDYDHWLEEKLIALLQPADGEKDYKAMYEEVVESDWFKAAHDNISIETVGLPADGEEVVYGKALQFLFLQTNASEYDHEYSEITESYRCLATIMVSFHNSLNSLRSEVSDVDKWDIEEIVEELKDLDFFDAAKAMFEKWSHVTKKSKLKEETN